MILLVLFCCIQPIDAPVEPFDVTFTYAQDTDPSFAVVDSLSLIGPDGKNQWTRTVGFPVSIYPLADGAALLALQKTPQSRKVELQFVDPRGNIIRTLDVEYFQGAEVSENLEAVLVHTAAGALLCSSVGEEVASYEGKFSRVALDATGTRVALTSDKTLFVYSGEEELTREEIKNPYVRALQFSGPGTRVAVLIPSRVEIWHQGEGMRFVTFNTHSSAPWAISFDSFSERLLVVLRGDDEFDFLIVDLDDYSTRSYSHPLSSLRETVITVQPAREGWLIHLTSGWFLFSKD